MSAAGGAVRRLAGPVGRVGLDVEGVAGGGLQVPDDVLQSHLTDGLLVFLLHRIWGRAQIKTTQRKRRSGKAAVNPVHIRFIVIGHSTVFQ